jgi:GTP-binding protein
VNPVKEKKTSNVRSVTADEKVQLAAPRLMTLEDAIGWVAGGDMQRRGKAARDLLH